MRSIIVPLELTVRLVRVVEGVENTLTCLSLLMFGRCIAALPLRSLTLCILQRFDGRRWRPDYRRTGRTRSARS
jgi:hypothetical protein